MSKRYRRIIVCFALLTGGLASGACRSATQAELDVSTTAQCSELGSVALVVSGDPASAEARVQQGFYAAQTTACDANRWIGSLVVTPGDDRAAVIVIAPPAGASISQCQPPKYAGCIVARRAFSFISHVGLKIPISLDVECKDVPCDAFSTCRKGSCYSSETSCDDTGTCLGAGELPDGGLSPDASIEVDGSPPYDAASDTMAEMDASTDSATDAGADADADTGVVVPVPPPGNVICNGTSLLCPSPVAVCSDGTATTGQACCVGAPPAAPACGVMGDAQCTGAIRYCCSNANCNSFGTVNLVSGSPFCFKPGGQPASTPGTCSGSMVAPVPGPEK